MVNYIFLLLKFQFLNDLIIIETTDLIPQTYVTLADFGYPVKVLLLPRIFKLFGFRTLTVPDEGDFRNMPCALILIFMFLMH